MDDADRRAMNRFGEYRLLEEIGIGGMGRVYRALDANGTQVAVKVANEAIVGSAAATRFEREALLDVDHPNLVKVVASGVEQGASYLVYNYLEGETVQEILQSGPMDPEDVVAMGTQICAGLGALHRAGVVHRDVKPANIIRSEDGHYTLIDFGLAQWRTEASRLTIEGQVLGTPAYLPPEQARGEVETDGRSDIWSLGVVLYECLSGVSPFERETPLATVLAVVMDEPPDLGEVAPHSPEVLRVALSRALRKNRSDRWSDVDVFAHALKELATRLDVVVGHEGQLSENERRLVVVLLAEELANAQELGRAVTEQGGVFLQLGSDRAVGIFGGVSSQGDELMRATSVGLASLGTAKRLAVASGYSTGRHSVVSGETLASAQEACALGLPGVATDPASARALAGRYDVQTRSGGHVVVAERDRFSSQELLIGRELELAQILREIELVAEERKPAVLLVSGERGIGKSSLLRSVETGIHERLGDAVVMGCGASAADMDTGLALIAELVADHFGEVIGKRYEAEHATIDVEAIESLLVDLNEHERSQCADFLAELVGVPPRETVQVHAARMDPQIRLDQVHFALRTYLVHIARRRPLFIILDDLQWCDAESIRLLAAVLAAGEDLPICIIGSALPENEERYTHLLEAHRPTVVALRALSRMQVARLAEAIACKPLPESVTKALALRTHGNPLFVEQLVLDMYAGVGDISEVGTIPLPLTVEVAVQSHLDNLGPQIKEFCKRAAVFTHAFSESEVVALGADCDEGLCDWLVQQGVLNHAKASNHRESRYVFRSSLVAEVAYGMLLDEQRRGVHLEAGFLLAKSVADSAENIARHFELGGERAQAGYWYSRAAQEAKKRGDSHSILRCSALALALGEGGDRFELHMARSDAFRFLGKREEQAKALEHALEAARTSRQKARATTEFAWNLSRTGQVERALQMAEDAVDLARDATDGETLALALGWRAVALAQLGRLDDSLDALGEASQTAKGASARVQALAAEWRAQVYSARGDLAQRLQAFVDAEAQYTTSGDVRRAAGAACNVADLYNRLGDFALAERELRQALEACRRVNHRLVEGYATANLGYALMRQGRKAEAMTELDYALMLAIETNEKVLKTVVGLYRCRAQLGQRPPSEILSEARRIAADASGLAPLVAMAHSIGSAAALLAAQPDVALEMATEAMAIRDELGGLEEDEAEIYVALARAQQACGDENAARETRRRGAQRVKAVAAALTDERLRETFLAMDAHALLLS